MSKRLGSAFSAASSSVYAGVTGCVCVCVCVRENECDPESFLRLKRMESLGEVMLCFKEVFDWVKMEIVLGIK